MSAHEFTLILDHAPTGEELDALFEAGCDDSTPETVASSGWLHFDRDAACLLEALTSAIRDVESTGLTVCAVVSDDLVSLKDVARRTGRTYEAARLWASGKRGPGGFPPPVTAADGWSLYSWVQGIGVVTHQSAHRDDGAARGADPGSRGSSGSGPVSARQPRRIDRFG